MGAVELIQQKAFIGKEFLTWLWFRAEIAPKIELTGAKPVEIEILGPIVLDAEYGDARASTLKGDAPATSPEALTSLLEGKKLSRAKLRIEREAVEWVATLEGETFNISGLNVPNPGRLPFDDALGLRMEFIREFEDIMRELFETFLELRLDKKAWVGELKAIHEWIRKK